MVERGHSPKERRMCEPMSISLILGGVAGAVEAVR